MAYQSHSGKEELQIDIADITRNLIKDLWLILIMGLAAVMLTYVFTNVFYKPEYTTKATFVVTSKGEDSTYENLGAATAVANSLSKIFDSNILKKKVALDIGTEVVEGSIRASVIQETDLVELAVTSTSPYMSYRIISSIMKNYTVVTDSMYGSAMLDLMEAPEVPMHPSNPLNNKRNMELAFLMGIAFSAVILGGISVLRDDIKSEKEVKKKLDTKLFGVIYHEKKYKTIRSRIRGRKKSILITSPTVSFHFVESFKKMRAKLEYKASQQAHNVFLVTSISENEGKSTIAVNLALALAQKSEYVMLVDADLSKPAIHKILQSQISESNEISNCIMSNSSFEECVSFDKNHGVFLAMGTKRCPNSTDIISKDSFREMIEAARKIMDYIIIDSPPISVSADTEILSDYADASLLVVRQSMARTEAINDGIDILSNSNSELLGCVYNDAKKITLGQNISYGNAYSYQSVYHKSDKNTA